MGQGVGVISSRMKSTARLQVMSSQFWLPQLLISLSLFSVSQLYSKLTCKLTCKFSSNFLQFLGEMLYLLTCDVLRKKVTAEDIITTIST